MRFIAFVSGVALSLSSPALAADTTASTASIETLTTSYERLLQHPGDKLLNLNYAALAMQLNDYEAAIPPLERIQMNEPHNAKIRLQIGVLYNLLGSKVMAKHYFMEAKSIEGAPSEVVKEAEGYLHGM